MENKREKDNLTDLVSDMSTSNGGSDNNGQVSAPTGEMVTLDFKTERRKLDRMPETDSEKIDLLLQIVIQQQKEIAELKNNELR